MTPALIKRVESATSEDRHLDAYIFAAFHREPIEPARTWSVMDSFQFTFTDGRKNALYVHEDDVPAYSSSLDAAVSLCDRLFPNCDLDFDRTLTDEGIEWLASIWDDEANCCQGTAKTGPLALVLAVLRAVTP